MAIRIRNNKQLDAIQVLSKENGIAAYRQLRKKVQDAGLLHRSYYYYTLLTTTVYSALTISFIGAWQSEHWNTLILYSICFAFASAQLGGLIHDAGHQAVFDSRWANDFLGHFCTVFFCGCYGNWRLNHNRHHAYPNQEISDPDIEIPFGFTPEFYARISGFMGLIKQYQTYTYYPLGLMASLTMRFKRYDYFKENFGPQIYWEIGLFVLSVLIRFVIPLILLGPERGLVFLLVSTTIEGFILFHVFAPNHKGMLELDADISGLSFIEHQVITSRNVSGNAATDFVFMGLNYQIEHHLFPNMPRNQLKKATPLVRSACHQLGLPYSDLSLVESNRVILRNLKAISSRDKQSLNPGNPIQT